MTVAPTRVAHYRRSPFVLLYWDGDGLCALQADSCRLFRGAERYVDLLRRLDGWATAEGVAATMGTEVSRTAGRLDQLVRMELVEQRADPPLVEERPQWNLVELAVQRQVAHGGAGEQAAPAPPQWKALAGEPVALPDPPLPDAATLGDALGRRRTRRRYRDGLLPLDALGAFLAATARATAPVLGDAPAAAGGRRWRRPYPSGGARYPLEIYAVCNAVESIAPGLYHYAPRDHRLVRLSPADARQAELNARLPARTGAPPEPAPHVVFLVTAVFARTMSRYDRMSMALIFEELGCLYQTMYLAATALDLAPCAVGRGDEMATARWLGLDPLVESQVGCFLLGLPAGDGA